MKTLSTVTIINVFVSLGFALVGLLRPEAILPADTITTPAATTFALYAAIRSVVLAGFVVVAVLAGNKPSLRLLAGIAAIIQFLDAGVGVYQHDVGKVIGPLVIAALQVWAISRTPQEAHRDV